MPERWHAWPVARVFPSSVPGTSPSGARVTYVLAGVAPESPCRVAFQPGVARLLRGCVTALRATYADSTQTFVATVGIAVLTGPDALRPLDRLTDDLPLTLAGGPPTRSPETGTGCLPNGPQATATGRPPGGLSGTGTGRLPDSTPGTGTGRLPDGTPETGTGRPSGASRATGHDHLPDAVIGRLPGIGPETGPGRLADVESATGRGDGLGDRSGAIAGRLPTVRPVAFPGGPAERFGESQYVTGALISSNNAYVVATAAGYADGRPYQPGELVARRLGDTARRLATALYGSLTR
ncbi:hypothetical protein [Nonomuraea aurantiaca]|uniref:hypothetical protein n=1 Tax=Nonomuraea aurantiaca TaxID=2878562 RepID=UPI001CD9E561|nr:hypothetical protein [Nonomuraea aurantiaca]MCA2229831.1 hypothetical protein [Nonomuraea aurantiaca]